MRSAQPRRRWPRCASGSEAVLGRFCSAAGLTGAGRGAVRGRRSAGRPAAAAARAGRSGDAPQTPASTGRRALLDGKVGASALQVVQAAVAQRWSSPWDLLDALEAPATTRCSPPRSSEGALDRGRGRAVPLRAHPGRRGRARRPARRAARSTPSGGVRAARPAASAARCTPITRDAARSTPCPASASAGHCLAIDDLLEAAAARRERSIARVISAVDADRRPAAAGWPPRSAEMYGRRDQRAHRRSTRPSAAAWSCASATRSSTAASPPGSASARDALAG